MTLSLAQMIAAARSAVREIPPAEACRALDRADVGLILDVREPDEYREGHLPDAINIPRGFLEIRADPASPGADAALSDAVSADSRLLHEGSGSALAPFCAHAREHGYEHVAVLAGGLDAWAEAGLPVEKVREGAER